MTPLITEIIGYTATVIGTCLMLPQVIKSIQTKRVHDLSYLMIILYFLNCLLWATYGILIWAVPLIVCNSIALIISIFQIGLKMKYGK